MKKYIFSLFIMLTACMLPSLSTAGDPSSTAPEYIKREDMTRDMRITRGGQLYDNWWKTSTTAGNPAEDHPLWKTQTFNTREGYSTFRCKECHGWDYRGKDGAYSKGSHFTGFKGIYNASKNMSLTELEDILKGKTIKDHDFTQYLSDEDISDLALFQKFGTIDLMELVNSDSSLVGGDITNGESFFTKNCMTECHGPSGTSINFGSEDKPSFISTVAKKNPWEFIHKVRAGQPGTRMSAGIINKWSSTDILDVVAYSRTLPADVPEKGWFDKLLSTLGLGKEDHTGDAHEEHRGFGPKLEQ